MLIQIIIILFIIFTLSRVSLKFRKKEASIKELIFWFIFWLLVGVAFFIPDFITRIANFLGIGRGADLVFYLAIVMIFYIIFRIYLRIEKIERDVTKIVRREALRESDEKEDIKNH